MWASNLELRLESHGCTDIWLLPHVADAIGMFAMVASNVCGTESRPNRDCVVKQAQSPSHIRILLDPTVSMMGSKACSRFLWSYTCQETTANPVRGM